MTLSVWAWRVAVIAHVALIVGLAGLVPAGWVLALVLCAPAIGMLRRSPYAHAVNSLIVLFFIAGLLVMRDRTGMLALSFVALTDFLACLLFVKLQAVERRAAGVR